MIVYWTLREGWDTPGHVEIPDESREELRKVIIGSAAFAVVGLIIFVLGSYAFWCFESKNLDSFDILASINRVKKK